MTEWQVTGLIVGALIVLWSIAALAFRKKPVYAFTTAYFSVTFSDPEMSADAMMEYMADITEKMAEIVENTSGDE
jgi:hypothetical protein